MPEQYTSNGVTYDRPSVPVMTADSLSTPQQPVVLPTPKVPTPPKQFIQNLQPAIQQSNQGLIQAQTQEAESRNDVLKNLLRVDDPNSQGTYDNRFNQLGGNDYLKQFTDANTRLAQLQGVFNTGSQKVSSAPGQSQVFEGLQLNEVSRQKAVEVGNQALVVQAMQGNIETARQIALDTTRFASEDRASKLQSLMAQFQSLDGIVQGQEKQLIDAQKIKVEQELKQLERAQTYIDSAISSGDASVEEMQQLTRTDLSDFDKQQIAAQIINRSAGAKTQFDRQMQLNQLKSYTKIGTDDFGNDVYGFVNPATGTAVAVDNNAINSQFADGTQGGQCGEFTKNLCTLPTPNGRTGNTWDEKKSFVDTYGMSKDQVLSGDVQPGDVFYYDKSIGSAYGHVETVVAVNGSQITFKGSNLDNQESVYTRTLDLNSMPGSFYGSIRGTMKDKFAAAPENNNQAITDAMRSVVTAPGITADVRKSSLGNLNRLIQSGDVEGAKQYVVSTAIASLPADQQNKAIGRLQAIDSLNSIRQLLQDYQSKGGNTDILTGTQEQIAQKLGNTSNPELANIGNRIALAMISYRSMVSGAAFTESEAKLYEDIFPSTKNIGVLNESKINSIIDAFNVNQKTTLSNVLGAKNYDAMMGGSTSQAIQATPEDDYANTYLSSLSTPTPQPTSGFQFSNPVKGLTKPFSDSYGYIKSLFGR